VRAQGLALEQELDAYLFASAPLDTALLLLSSTVIESEIIGRQISSPTATRAIEYRWGEGRGESTAEAASELVNNSVDVILAGGTAPAVAAKKATAVIPIVFGLAGDPVGIGLVANLARPGGNVTGLSAEVIDFAGKRLEILRELIPSFRRLAILANPQYPGLTTEISELQAAARTLGLDVTTSEIRQASDIAPAFEALSGRLTRSTLSPTAPK
jgi:putative ABC transport system substrate-binding protein